MHSGDGSDTRPPAAASSSGQASSPPRTGSHPDLQARGNQAREVRVRPRSDLHCAEALAPSPKRAATGPGIARPLPQAPAGPQQACTDAAKSATTAADFENVAVAIERLPEDLRAGPARDLAQRLVELSAHAPMEAACAAYASTFKAAESVPAGAADKRAALDTARHLLAATNHLDIAFTAATPRLEVTASRLGEQETEALQAGYMQARAKLRPFMLKQELGKDPAAVRAILGECYREGNNPALVQFASTLMQGLIASADDKAQVAVGLMQLARLAAGPHGTRTIPDDGTGFDWAEKCAKNIEVFVERRNLNAAPGTSLGDALKALRSAPKHGSHGNQAVPEPRIAERIESLHDLGEQIQTFLASEEGPALQRHASADFAGLPPLQAGEERNRAEALGLLQPPRLDAGSVEVADVAGRIESQLAAMAEITDTIPKTMAHALAGRLHEIPAQLETVQRHAKELRLKMTGVRPDALGKRVDGALITALGQWAAKTDLLLQSMTQRYGARSTEARLSSLINHDAQFAHRDAAIQVLANCQGAEAFRKTSADFMGRFDGQPELQRFLARAPAPSSTYRP